MTGFETPFIRDERIDPVIAMLIQRRMEGTNEQHFAALDKIAEMYASFCQFEFFQQQQQQLHLQQQQQLQTEPVNLSSSNNGPTYTELQTVRGKDTADDVLRQHQQQQNEPSSSSTPVARSSSSPPPPTTPTPSPSPANKSIKTEVVELPASYPGIHSVQSVQMTSVYPPADASVREIDASACAQSADGIVGVGDRICTINVGNSTIQVRCDQEEVRHISELSRREETADGIEGKKFHQRSSVLNGGIGGQKQVE